MGFCMESKGRFAIEMRRESFTVHADYGYETVDGVTVHASSADVFGKHWRETPHPEFLLEDLDDLILALQGAKKYLKERGR